jgi:hypothetical protein
MQLLSLDSVLHLIDDPVDVPSVRLLKTSRQSGGRLGVARCLRA